MYEIASDQNEIGTGVEIFHGGQAGDDSLNGAPRTTLEKMQVGQEGEAK